MSLAIAFTREQWALIRRALSVYEDEYGGIDDKAIDEMAIIDAVIEREINDVP